MATTHSVELRDGLSTVTRGTLLVLISTVCLVILNFVSRVLLVRSPPADWNSFSLELTLASILGAIANLGLPNAVARNLPHAVSDDERRAIIRTSVGVTTLVAILTAGALWFAAPNIADSLRIPNLVVGLHFFAVAIATSLIAGLITSVFRGFSDAVPFAVFYQIVNPALFVALLLSALVVPPRVVSYSEALLAYALANSVTLALLIGYALHRLPRLLPVGPVASGASARLFRFTAPLFVVSVMITLAGTGDTIVLGTYHPNELGVYTASLTLARLVAVGIASFSFIFLPVATKFLRGNNPESVHVTYATITKWMLAFSLPLSLLFILVPGRALTLVYGPSFSTITWPLRLSVAGAFAATLLGPGSTTQIAYGRVRLLAVNAAVAGGLDVGLAVLLAPSLGYTGSAIAWGTSTLVFAGLCLAELVRMDGVRLFSRNILLPLALTAVPSSILLLTCGAWIPELALPLVGIAIGATFVIVTLVTRSVDEGDRLLLEAVESMIGRPLPIVRNLARWLSHH